MPGVLGIHFEGPFLSPERAGVHDPAMFRSPGAEDVALLTASGHGVTLVTLAPECVPAGFIADLAGAGVRVALGHSQASYDETRAAFAEGLTGLHASVQRDAAAAGARAGTDRGGARGAARCYGLIVDGEHVAPAMLRLALRGEGQPMLVTDAMPPVGGIGRFTLYGKEILVRDGRCATADGIARRVGARHGERGAQLRPAARHAALRKRCVWRRRRRPRFSDSDGRLGRLAPGYRADIVALDPAEVAVLATWVAGAEQAIERQPCLNRPAVAGTQTIYPPLFFTTIGGRRRGTAPPRD